VEEGFDGRALLIAVTSFEAERRVEDFGTLLGIYRLSENAESLIELGREKTIADILSLGKEVSELHGNFLFVSVDEVFENFASDNTLKR
jgi:hypothetical protein